VWDPRVQTQDADNPDTWAWSDNAALVILDYLRHESGFAMPLAWIEPELAAWIAAADICDEAVSLAAGGTAARYRIWGTYGYDERPADVLARLLSACNGRLWIGANGGLALSVGAWSTPSVTLGDEAIVAYRLASGSEAPEAANTLSAVYVDPAQGYIETEAEAWTDPASVAAFGEQKSDARLYMVPGHSQARRLMKQALAKIAPEWRGTLTTNLAGLAALTERFVAMEIDELGLSITAEIDNIEFRVEAGNVISGLIIEFTAMTAAAFAWSAAAEEGSAAHVPPALTGDAIPEPAGFAVSVQNRDGVYVGTASWNAFTVSGLAVRVEYRIDGTTDWLTVTSAADATSVEFSPLVNGATYEVRARTIGLTRQSGPTDIIEVLIGSGGVGDALLLEDGSGNYVLEDGSGVILLE
jgi:hypothetical protein